MRRLLAPIIALGLASTLAAQTRSSDADTPMSPEIRRVLAAAAEAYRKPRGLTDRVTMAYGVKGAERTRLELDYGFGSGTDAFVTIPGRPGMSVVALDGRLFLTKEDVSGKYVDVPLQGDLPTALDALLGGNAPSLPAPLLMRAGRGADACVNALGMGILTNARATGYGLHRDAQGGTAHEITIEGDNGRSLVRIDSASSLIRRIDLEAVPPGGSEDVVWTATLTFDPKPRPTAEGAVTFDPGSRSAVASMGGLRLTVGDVAPDFTLSASDGTTVTLSSLKGYAVVLDFWATWCAPCRRGLPLLEAFHVWAKSSRRPIRVYAVNCLEHGKTAEEKMQKATDFWTRQKFTVPTLFDVEGSVSTAYQVQGIPLSVIIGPDGRIAEMRTGFDPDMTKTLRREVEKVMTDEG